MIKSLLLHKEVSKNLHTWNFMHRPDLLMNTTALLLK